MKPWGLSRTMVAAMAWAMLAALLPCTAFAHKMKVFATAEAGTVTGHVYFSPGGPAMEIKVIASDGDGKTVFEGLTSREGRFSFPVSGGGAIRLSADSGDGHAASFIVAAAAEPVEVSPPAVAGTATPPVSTSLGRSEIEALLDARLAAQLVPLREQIDLYQEKIRWHDVVGGIGYIVGLAGFAYGWSSRRRPLPPSPSSAKR